MNIPRYVHNLVSKLNQAGFKAYLVGGCVRDLLLLASLGRTTNAAHTNEKMLPKDWDIATNARPEEILKVFSRGKYENNFGTVLVPVETAKNKKEIIEITTYRSEQGYSDRRHPDEVVFEDSLEKDLSRRDFTINAMALEITSPLTPPLNPPAGGRGGEKGRGIKIVDLFGGQKDLDKKIIRSVGEPVDRFKEDALRMLRAVRLACQLDFIIEPKTARAATRMAGSIKFIARERIRDELIKILTTDKAYEGVKMLSEMKLLQYIIPELEAGANVKQDRHHIYTVFKHSLLSLKHTPNKEWQVRLASLLHDIGKPKTKKFIKGVATFYNHEYVSAKMANKIMRRLKFSRSDTERVTNLIRHHMFYYNVDEVTASSVRRLIRKVGRENLADLIDLRIADRLGSGVPKAKPYKLRHLEYMFKRVENDPVSVKMLKINGDDLMQTLKIKPGPKIGAILDILLGEVIEDPKRNNKEYLETRSRDLDKLDIVTLRKKAKDKIEEKREKDDRKMKGEFWVK